MATGLVEQQSASQRDALTEVQSNRQSQEVQAAMIVARKFPRDEENAMQRIVNSCKRKKLAEAAIYSYPRGNTTVDGPSIRLAETMAQCWGNLDFGVVELEQRDGESTAMAYCWDLETNVRQTKIFQVRHVRHTRAKDYALTDPRDVYELVANQGARRLRSCILGVIPGDIVDAAVEQVQETLRSSDGGKPLSERVKAMAVAFADMGITQKQLEARVGHNLDALTETELVNLRKIYISVKDGAATLEDWFTDSQPAQTKDELPPSVFEQYQSEIGECTTVQDCESLMQPMEKSKKLTADERETLLAMLATKRKRIEGRK
jgi:hypothetical protein